jgi:hypothetical protein
MSDHFTLDIYEIWRRSSAKSNRYLTINNTDPNLSDVKIIVLKEIINYTLINFKLN